MCYISHPECYEALGAKNHAKIACHGHVLSTKQIITYIETSGIVHAGQWSHTQKFSNQLIQRWSDTGRADSQPWQRRPAGLPLHQLLCALTVPARSALSTPQERRLHMFSRPPHHCSTIWTTSSISSASFLIASRRIRRRRDHGVQQSLTGVWTAPPPVPSVPRGGCSRMLIT